MLNRNFTLLLLLLIGCLLVPAGNSSAQGTSAKLSVAMFESVKKPFDDPRPYLKRGYLKEFLSEADYKKLLCDPEGAKEIWARTIGLRAPDLVGKIAPEIGPGKYSYKDKEKYPGLKELLTPDLYKRFNPGALPHGGNFPEITVIPTRQYYWHSRIGEASEKSLGKVKLNDKGYLIDSSYEAGYPFPRPSGKFKAQQIAYNWLKRYLDSGMDSVHTVQYIKGVNRNLKMDLDGATEQSNVRLKGRALMEPYGWFDSRAQANGETGGVLVKWVAPRDNFGTAFTVIRYEALDKDDQFHAYIPAMRRVRKMSASDTQDAVGGQDVIYEDQDGFQQKLSPTRYPYKFEIIAEREYLVPSYTTDGSMYLVSKGVDLRNVVFERRPIYVLKLTQQDKNYVYGQRIMYIDMETFNLHHVDNFDQKGRLYRQTTNMIHFLPEMGFFVPELILCRDLIDDHTAWMHYIQAPAPWLTRDHLSLSALAKGSK